MLQPSRGRKDDKGPGLDHRQVPAPGQELLVTEAVSVDEDGLLLDRVITHELKQPTEVGKKWGG